MSQMFHIFQDTEVSPRNKKSIVRLTEREPQLCREMVRSLKGHAQKVHRANVLSGDGRRWWSRMEGRRGGSGTWIGTSRRLTPASNWFDCTPTISMDDTLTATIKKALRLTLSKFLR